MYEYMREKAKLCYSNNCSTKIFVAPLVYGHLSALVRHMRMVAQLTHSHTRQSKITVSENKESRLVRTS